MPNEAVLQEIEIAEPIQSVSARLPQAVGRHGGTGRHLDHDHRLSRRAGTGPLTPGVTYEFWLVGHNFRGDGPESNHVTHAVPVGP
jgi:hypothetical protein